ncbi:hypothetical protein U27_03877 [Candidatus Vecturithrix granuli]|uniref:Uncharacterized protein n=1 Tax=Vecturithrix granuli TaxID=1499967 RepID=A0A081BX58_VECG1|nr:hypothetical protein U27_03877 [Candidatus Vecturithrix granuli]
MAQKLKNVERCGFLAILVMLVTGTIFGSIGVILAHIGMKFYPDYYLVLIFPIVIGILLGIGFSLGARIGHCCRVNIIVFLIVFLFSVIAYGSFLFLNHYYDSLPERPQIVLDEVYPLKEDVQNFLAALPYVSDYIPSIQQAEGMEPRNHIGVQLMTFFTTTLPEQAFRQAPVVIGTIFDLALLAPIRDYLLFPGITRWNEDMKRLEFDEMAVRPWMVWSVEFFFLWLIAFLKTLKGSKKARENREERLKKRGAWSTEDKHLTPAEKKQKERGQKKSKIASQQAAFDMTPPQQKQAEPAVEPEPKKEKKKWFSFGRKKQAESEQEATIEPAQEEQKKTKEKKKGGWFGKKSVETEGETTTAEQAASMEFAAEQGPEQRYALILHQYETKRQNDLLWLVQQVSQVSEDRARKLLKVPSLLKRDVTPQEAQIAIEKFKQVQAQVKLITMEQLAEIQKKQQPSVQPVRPAPQQQPSVAAKSPESQPKEDMGERYALILRKIEPTQRKQVLELLSSLSNTPIAQLQQNLKTPALVLRDATKDEVTMIAQQFRMIQADVKMLTMAELQKLMTRK